MKLFGTHLVFFVGGSGMKQFETYMREPFSKDSGMKLIDTNWWFSQRVSLKDSGITICEICLECFVLRLLYENSSLREKDGPLVKRMVLLRKDMKREKKCLNDLLLDQWIVIWKLLESYW